MSAERDHGGAPPGGATTASPRRYFEDFTVGLRFESTSSIVVSAERIKAFASEFDPQPSHLDESAARTTLLGGLVASGWHTAAVTMRLIVDSNLGLSGQGAGVQIESMRWPRPVHPGDRLRLEGTVTESRASSSRADRGIVKFEVLAYNQNDELVLEATHVIVVMRRSFAAPP
jgi:acyl dehydratase